MKGFLPVVHACRGIRLREIVGKELACKEDLVKETDFRGKREVGGRALPGVRIVNERPT